MYRQLLTYARLVKPSNRAVHTRLRQLLHSQWLSSDELQALQLEKAQRMVKHAFTYVPFYNQRFRQAGIHPDDIQTLGDLLRIPVLTRADVQDNLESLVSTSFPRTALHQDATGGSTGQPLRFYHADDWAYWNWAAGYRIWYWYGLSQGCKRAFIAGRDFIIPTRFRDKLISWLRRERWLSSFDMGEDKMQAFAETLIHFKPELVAGYNSSLWLFAQYMDRTGITGIRPRVVMGGAEKLYDFQREVMKKAYRCPVVSYYASRENGPMAAECPHGSMHWNAEVRYLEVLVDGRPAAPGETGEVVVTDLTNFAMPFIRYKNGDLATLEDQPCTCGRGLPVLRELVGRKSDLFKTPDGRWISGIYFVHRLRGWPGVKKYQVHQPSLDKIEIIFEAGEGLDEVWLKSRQQELQKHLGESVQLSFTRVDDIPLMPTGKYLFLTSAVPVDLGTQDDQ